MKNKKIAALFLITVLFISIFSGCTLQDKPPAGELLEKIQKAYNDQDTEALIKCFEPSTAKKIQGLTELIGINDESLGYIIPFFSELESFPKAEKNGDRDWGTAVLTEVSADPDPENSSKVLLKYQVSIRYSDGESENFTHEITAVLTDGVWYAVLSK